MKLIAPNLWTLEYHLPLLGTEQGRVVTIIRIESGELIIHSTGPFSPEDVEAISSVGRPAWLIDAMLYHDTFAQQGRAAFPGIPYLAPEGFASVAKVDSQPILPVPSQWNGEVEVVRLEGAPKIDEHVFFHVPSRTLVVADLVFNFNGQGTAWERFFRRYAIGLKHQPGMSRIFRAFVADRAAFERSIAQMMRWNFDRVIVAHKEMIASGAKEKLRQALHEAGFNA